MTEPEQQERPEPQRGADQAIDALVTASRVHRGIAMDGNGEYVALTNPDVGRIRKAVSAFLEDQERLPKGRRITRAKLADAIGESKSTVSQVLACKYPQSKTEGWRRRDDVLRKLDKFLAIEAARRESPPRGDFAWTKVAEEVRGVADTATILETIGVVYGPAGIGKTLTLQALQGVHPGSVLVTIDDRAHSQTTFIRVLCDRVRLNSSRHRQSMFDALCKGLKGSKRLIMVDEAHLADLNTLTTIRQLHDATGCPILLAGLPALPRMLLHGRGDDSKGATLHSRIGVIRDLTERCRAGGDRGSPLFSVADIKKVFAQSTLRIASDAAQWLQGLACLPDAGGLRQAGNAVRLAIRIAQQKNESEITLEGLLSVSQLLLGVEGAKSIANKIRQSRKVA